MEPITITTENFDAEVLHSEKPVLLDFWASWCGPCRMLSPIVDEVAEERSDVKVGKVNVDEQPDLAAQFGVMSTPRCWSSRTAGSSIRRSVPARRAVCWPCWIAEPAPPKNRVLPRCAHPAPGGAFLRPGGGAFAERII